jgi:hypothetical protein
MLDIHDTKRVGSPAAAIGAMLGLALGIAAPSSLEAQSCTAAPTVATLVRGVGASGDSGAGGGGGAASDRIVYASPRAELGVFDAEGEPLPGWTLAVDGNPASSLPSPLAEGDYRLVATPGPDCSDADPVRARLTVDGVAPELNWRVTDLASVAGEIPDPGLKKRFLWWWVQPEKRRLVWADGPGSWAPLRQKVGVEVRAQPGRSRLYVWAPDESPFEGGGAQSLGNEQILVIEASDVVSGIGGLRIRLVERGSKAATADDGAEYVMVVEATDRVGNSIEIELPYVAEQAEGPRKGPF